MPHTVTSALVTGRRVDAGGTRAAGYGYTAFLTCASVLPLVSTGFLVQLLAHAAPGLLTEWRLHASDLATALAMAPAGLLAGAAFGHGLRQLEPWRVLRWSGAAMSICTAAMALARTPVDLGTLCLLASTAAGISVVMAGRLASYLFLRRVRYPLSAVAATLLAAGGVLAAWCVGPGLALEWRALFVAAGLVSLASPLALLLVPSAGRPRLSGPAAAVEGVMEDPATAGTRATFGRLIGASHARETLSLFALSCFTGMVAGMAALLIPLVLAQPGWPSAAATRWLWTLNLAAIAGALAAAGLRRISTGAALRTLAAAAALAAGMLAIREGMPSAAALRAALLVCGFATTAALVAALRLAAACGPPGAQAAVGRATVAFMALGAVVGTYVGVHASIAGGLSGFFAAWTCCFSAAAVAAVVLPPPPRRNARSQPGVLDRPWTP
jgi:hypothetical protein